MPAIFVNDKDLLPLRRDFDFYPTPFEVCEAGLKVLLNRFYPYFILDAGAGNGVWGKALKKLQSNNFLIGVEIRDIEKPEWYDKWVIEDFTKFNTGLELDLVMGNPPYKFVEQFLDKALELVRTNGFVLFLLRLSFLESLKRYNKYFNNNLNPKEVWVSTRRVDFYREKNSKSAGNYDAFGIFIWERGYTGDTTLNWLDWNYHEHHKYRKT